MNAERSIRVGPVLIDIRSDDDAPHQIFIRFTGIPDKYYFPDKSDGQIVTSPSDGGFADAYVHDLLGMMMFVLNVKGIDCGYNYNHADKSFSLISNEHGVAEAMCHEAGNTMVALAKHISPDGSNYKEVMKQLQAQLKTEHSPRNKNLPSPVKLNVRTAVRTAINDLQRYYPKRSTIVFHSADIGDSIMNFITKEGKTSVTDIKSCALILVNNYLMEAEDKVKERLAGEIALKVNGAVSHKDRARRGSFPENSR